MENKKRNDIDEIEDTNSERLVDEKSNSSKPKKARFFDFRSKSFDIVTSVVLICTIGIGTTFGIIFGKSHFAEKVDYDQYNEFDLLDDDMTDIMQKYNSISKDEYATKFEPYQLPMIGIHRYAQENDCCCYTLGVVHAGPVNQTLRNAEIRHGVEHYAEALSCSSLEKTAKRFYQNENESTVTTHLGKNIKPETATWTEENSYTLSTDEHEAKWGKLLTRPLIYIVSSKTVIESSLRMEGNTYVIETHLDPIKGVARYIHQVVSMSDKIKGYPTFDYITLTFRVDENLDLISYHIDEKYVVTALGMQNNTVSDLTIYYRHNDQQTKIPSLDEDFIYPKEGGTN